MAYITKRGSSYGVRYTYQDEQGKNCNKWESFSTKEEATNRKKQIEHELANGTFLILQEFEDKREGSTTTLVLKKTKTASSIRTIFMTTVLKEELKHWFKRLEMDEAVEPERYRNSGMLLRLPNGLAVEPILIRKSSSSGRTSTRSSRTSSFTVYGIPVPPIS